MNPRVSAATMPRPAELGRAVSRVSEKAAGATTEAGDGSVSSSSTRSTDALGAEEDRRFGGDGVSSRQMGAPVASSSFLWRGGDGAGDSEKASRK